MMLPLPFLWLATGNMECGNPPSPPTLPQERWRRPVDDTLFSSYLLTAGMPDPDLLIRTTAKCVISNFLLWQMAYTELYFTDVNWPEFDAQELHRALADFQERERRFGRTSDQLHADR